MSKRSRRATCQLPQRPRSQLLPERVPREPADADVLADRRDPIGDQVANGTVLVAERLVQLADLGEPLLQLTLHDLGSDRLRLLLDRLVGEELRLPGLQL